MRLIEAQKETGLSGEPKNTRFEVGDNIIEVSEIYINVFPESENFEVNIVYDIISKNNEDGKENFVDMKDVDIKTFIKKIINAED